MAGNERKRTFPAKRVPKGIASRAPSAEQARARRRILVAEKTMLDWTASATREWLASEHGIECSNTTVLEDRRWLIAEAAQDADAIRQLKIAQMLEISRGMLPLIHGTGKVLVRDEGTFEQDPDTGELIDGIRALTPTTGQRLEVLKQWMHLAGELRHWVGVDKIEATAKPDPADMGMSDVDRELAELAALLNAQPERR